MRVLIADDDESVHLLLGRVLQRQRACATVHAANGIDALARLDDECCDGVILDLEMPLLGGLEVLQALRATPRHRTLPVAMLTASGDATAVREILALGVQAYIIKPLRPGAAIDKLLAFTEGLVHAPMRQDEAPRAVAAEPRLLVADGDIDMRQFVASVLGHRFDVELAATGAHAAQLALARRPDLILLGHQLDPLAAPRVVDVLRRQPALARVPVLALGEVGIDTGLLLGQLPRTFVVERFLAAFDALVPHAHAATVVRTMRPVLVAAMAQACQQLFGVDAGPLPLAATSQDTDPSPGVSLRFTTAASQFEIGLGLPPAAVAALARLMAARPTPRTDDGSHPLAPVLQAIGRRVTSALADRGQQATLADTIADWDGAGLPHLVIATDAPDLRVVVSLREVSAPRAD